MYTKTWDTAIGELLVCKRGTHINLYATIAMAIAFEKTNLHRGPGPLDQIDGLKYSGIDIVKQLIEACTETLTPDQNS